MRFKDERCLSSLLAATWFALVLGIPAAASAQGAGADASNRWVVELTPYLWAAGLDGTTAADGAGSEIWVRRYNGPGAGADWATSIAVDAAGNSYVTGASFGTSTTKYDFATLSYDPAGTVRWTERYNGPANSYDTPYAIAVDSFGSVYVSGSDGGSGTGLDYATIKYAPAATGVASSPQDPRGGFALESDPNPFTPATKIRFTIPGVRREHVRLALVHVGARPVPALFDDQHVAAGLGEGECRGRAAAAAADDDDVGLLADASAGGHPDEVGARPDHGRTRLR